MALQNNNRNGKTLIQRFTGNELAQHWVLFVSLTILALTGLALFWGDTAFGRWLINLEGGVEARGLIHRIFAIVLMVLAAWHFAYVLFTDRGHRQLMEMLPRLADFKTVRELVGYYFGKGEEGPVFGRFTPMQKLQYWGAGLGSLLMIATGLVLWFHTQAMAAMPKWVIDVTTIIHGYEGLILFAMLFVWHLYIVHLSPGSFPMQTTFISGRISPEQLWREHRAEYVKLFGDTPPEKDATTAEKGDN